LNRKDTEAERDADHNAITEANVAMGQQRLGGCQPNRVQAIEAYVHAKGR